MKSSRHNWSYEVKSPQLHVFAAEKWKGPCEFLFIPSEAGQPYNNAIKYYGVTRSCYKKETYWKISLRTTIIFSVRII